MLILKILAPLVVVLLFGGYILYLYFSSKVVERPGIYLQITLPDTDDTPVESIAQVLSMLHDMDHAYYSFEEISSEQEGFRICLWVSMEGHESEEEVMTLVEDYIAGSFNNAVVEKIEDKIGEEKAVIPVQLAQPYWYSLKGLGKFKKTETLNMLASMLNGRLQIVAKPEPQWSAKVEQQLTSMTKGIHSGGFMQDIIKGVTSNITTDMREVHKEMTGTGKNAQLNPLEKTKISAGWDSLEYPAFRCEIRILASDQAAAKKAIKGLSIFNLPGANQLVEGREDPKLVEFAVARDFMKKRAREKNKIVLPADILGAVWHFAGKSADAHNIVHAGARTIPIPQSVPRLESDWLDEYIYTL